MQDNFKRIDQNRGIFPQKKPRRSSSKRYRANADDFIRFQESPLSTPRISQPLFIKLSEVFLPSYIVSTSSESEKLRSHISLMICIHFSFVLIEILVYNNFLILIGSELLYIWLIYYGFMTLSKVALMSYIGLMFLAPISGMLFVLQIGEGFIAILFFSQMAFYGYAGGFYTFVRLRSMQI